MNEVAHDLAAEMRIALARYFSNLKAGPLGGAPRELVAAGRKVYQEGVPDAKVVPCRLCHGEAAHGDAFIPRLAGQLHDYMINKLVDWRRERGLEPSKRDASSIMEPIVHGLTQPPIEAVAAYLSYLD
jgi:cytochrome c553